MRLGLPRAHFATTTSTNDRARELAMRGAPHGTLVTAAAQTAGRGRQGRTWSVPPGRALIASFIVRGRRELLSLAAGVAVAQISDADAMLKWPNDVLIGGRKVAGILVEGRPAEGWAVLGIGLNVAVRETDLPAELRQRAGSLGLSPADVEPVLDRLVGALERWLEASPAEIVDAVRARDALLGRPLTWEAGRGWGAGIDDGGRLLVDVPGGGRLALGAGEVHLGG
jgi:BirA family biotin operon repressor/biotin-[acetyl-CoA-carboxylase] ligase